MWKFFNPGIMSGAIVSGGVISSDIVKSFLRVEHCKRALLPDME
jgi:hypothetical protein